MNVIILKELYVYFQVSLSVSSDSIFEQESLMHGGLVHFLNFDHSNNNNYNNSNSTCNPMSFCPYVNVWFCFVKVS